MASGEKTVTVFGGTGFLGRRLVYAMAGSGFRARVASRNARVAAFPQISSRPEFVETDIRDREAVASALEGASAAINAVSLYSESGTLTFDAIHVEGTARVAKCCAEGGVQSLVHISGIGSNEESRSALIRAKARGEKEVFGAFQEATIFRPSVLFGRHDAFLSGIEAASKLPVVPLFGRGRTRLQPAWVRDIARAAVRAITLPSARGRLFELGGARVMTYREAVEAVCDALGRRRLLMPFPMSGWKALVWAMRALPNPPLDREQLHLLAMDNTASQDCAGFEQLGIHPAALHDKLEQCLK